MILQMRGLLLTAAALLSSLIPPHQLTLAQNMALHPFDLRIIFLESRSLETWIFRGKKLSLKSEGLGKNMSQAQTSSLTILLVPNFTFIRNYWGINIVF
jgi:hypothetical protein